MRSPDLSFKGLSFKVQIALVVALLLVWAAVVAFTDQSAVADRSNAKLIQPINSLGVPDELVPDILPGISSELEGVFGLPGADGTSGPGSFLKPVVPSGSFSSVPGSGPAVPQGPGFGGQSVASGGNVVPDLFEQAESESNSGEDGEADGPGEEGESSDGTSTKSGAGGAGGDGESEDDGNDADDEDDDEDDEKDKDRDDD